MACVRSIPLQETAMSTLDKFLAEQARERELARERRNANR
jgi:hypothetical protein